MAGRVPEAGAATEAKAVSSGVTIATVSPEDVLQRLMHDGIFDALKNKILADLKQNVRTALSRSLLLVVERSQPQKNGKE